jgi:hypothetical protein
VRFTHGRPRQTDGGAAPVRRLHEDRATALAIGLKRDLATLSVIL